MPSMITVCLLAVSAPAGGLAAAADAPAASHAEATTAITSDGTRASLRRPGSSMRRKAMPPMATPLCSTERALDLLGMLQVIHEGGPNLDEKRLELRIVRARNQRLVHCFEDALMISDLM